MIDNSFLRSIALHLLAHPEEKVAVVYKTSLEAMKELPIKFRLTHQVNALHWHSNDKEIYFHNSEEANVLSRSKALAALQNNNKSIMFFKTLGTAKRDQILMHRLSHHLSLEDFIDFLKSNNFITTPGVNDNYQEKTMQYLIAFNEKEKLTTAVEQVRLDPLGQTFKV